MNDCTLRIGVFASGRGSNLQAIINSIEAGDLTCKIEFVLSNNSDSGALEIARKYSIPAIHLSERNYYSESFESSFFQVLRKYNPDLIILAGYMKLIPQNIVTDYCNRIINIHPALLPNFGGKRMFGMNVHNAVFESKEKYSGVSVHLVNEEYDKGKVLYQEKVDVSDCKTPEEIADKILILEHKVYPMVLKMICEKKIELN